MHVCLSYQYVMCFIMKMVQSSKQWDVQDLNGAGSLSKFQITGRNWLHN